MKRIVRNALGSLVGLLLGGVLNMALVVLGSAIVPPPPGVDVTNVESIAESVDLFEAKHFVFPFLAHALGTLVGALAAYLIAASHRHVVAYVVGTLFLAGGITNAFAIPAPAWFIVIDLVLAYMPMAWLGTRLGGALQTRLANPPTN